MRVFGMLAWQLLIASLLGTAIWGWAPLRSEPTQLKLWKQTKPQHRVPATLREALFELDKGFSGDGREQFLLASDASMATSMFHHGLGTWMRNEWGLWREGPLYEHFETMGLHHPDDMSGVILSSFWRWKHGRPLRVAEQVSGHLEYWENARSTASAGTFGSPMTASECALTTIFGRGTD